ncbi:MAG: small, acid-soluble spore protein, alpha/beta type [Lachnospiraceae bacterium]|nr:small, acid-soluble spore protein, alpha/beta type [Lachnospiraceae bacterium]
MARKNKKIDLNNLTPEEKLKLEIAEEIGVYDKVIEGGWRALSAKESGKIGGLMSGRKKALREQSFEE